jgi:spore germination protein GerM
VSLIRVKIVVILLVVVAGVLLFALRERRPEEALPEGGVLAEDVGPGVQTVVLVFGDRSASRLVEERREIVVPDDRSERARRILEALAEGPSESGAVRTLPEGTKVRKVVFDGTGGAYVDFSRELVDNHPGGSTGELFTIRSVVQTLARNFPDVETVRFLVEGKEIETIAGHIDASVPMSVEQYE